jgi:hypothetical protein
MAEATGKVTQYNVRYTVGATEHDGAVAIIDGYSTLDALPRILAVKHGVGVAEVSVQHCVPAITYGWIITADHVEAGKRVGTMGPGGISAEVVAALKAGKGAQWQAYDDDGELYYAGRYYDPSEAGNEFAPLDNFAGPNAGATELRYRQADGTWKAL